MIELVGVNKTFERGGIRTHALRNIGLRIEKGEIFGVIGYSGAGKSTLLRTVNLLERPTSGSVYVEERALDTMSIPELRQMKKRIGMIFQHFNLLESKTVFRNVAIPLMLEKKSKKYINKRVMELLRFVGLEHKADGYPSELSGGQKQRVGIARALASNPSILLCDEATSALDPQTTASILRLLKKINEQYRITIMIITHEMAVIRDICDRVAVMENGEIVEQGRVLDMFGYPSHPTTQAFVGTVLQNELPQKVQAELTSGGTNRRFFRIEFVGKNPSVPLITNLLNNHEGVETDILTANTSEIAGETIGSLLLELKGEAGLLEKAKIDLISGDWTVKEVCA